MQSSPSKAAGRSGALGVRGRSCRVAVVCEVHERHLRALVRLQRVRVELASENLVGYRALAFLIWIVAAAKRAHYSTTARKKLSHDSWTIAL